MADNLRESALEYHRFPRPGKLAIQATKPMASQRDLSLAYSSGVAARPIADLGAYTRSLSLQHECLCRSRGTD